ncbi:hypothetical protein ACLOJK_023739 [Asimina triloba]
MLNVHRNPVHHRSTDFGAPSPTSQTHLPPIRQRRQRGERASILDGKFRGSGSSGCGGRAAVRHGQQRLRQQIRAAATRAGCLFHGCGRRRLRKSIFSKADERLQRMVTTKRADPGDRRQQRGGELLPQRR